MGTWLVIFGVGLAVAVALATQVLRRAWAMKQLLADGVEAQARVVSRRRRHSKKGGPRLSLSYEYRDPTGQTYGHTSAVGEDEWQAHPEGSHFAIVYSRSKPATSMPRSVVERSRAAMRGR